MDGRGRVGTSPQSPKRGDRSAPPTNHDDTGLRAPFAPLFSKRVFLHVGLLLTASILVPGKRTVASALRVVGLDKEKRYCRYHRVLSRAACSTREASRRLLLDLLVEASVPDGRAASGRCRGDSGAASGKKKIGAKEIYRDPLKSSHTHFVETSALRWVCLGAAGSGCMGLWGFWALPFLAALALPNATQESEESDIRSLPSGPGNCFCR